MKRFFYANFFKLFRLFFLMLINLKKFFDKLFIEKDKLYTSVGRSALQAIIEEFNLKNSKMIIQSFICSNVFSASSLQNNIKLVLVDNPKNKLNITLSDIKKAYKNDKKIKSVLIVHTFGLINKEIDKISNWCKKNNLILIEDAVYCFNMKYKGKQIGTFGDAAIFSFHKSFNFFMSSVYLKNNGKINVSAKPYKINKLDLLRFIKLIPFSRLILKILRPIKTKAKIKIDPTKVKIISAPWFFNFFYTSSKKLNIRRRRNVALSIYNILKKENPNICPKLEISSNFFFSIPLFVKNKNKIFNELIKKGIICSTRWTVPLSRNKLILKNQKINKTPNAEELSKKIFHIFIFPTWNKRKIERTAKIISKVIKKYN